MNVWRIKATNQESRLQENFYFSSQMSAYAFVDLRQERLIFINRRPEAVQLPRDATVFRSVAEAVLFSKVRRQEKREPTQQEREAAAADKHYEQQYTKIKLNRGRAPNRPRSRSTALSLY